METLDKEKVAIGWISCLTTFGKGSWPRETPQEEGGENEELRLD